MKKFSKDKRSVVHFSTGYTTSDFQQNDDGSVVKKALVMVEGLHKDNRGREWEVDSEKIELMAENTNRMFSNGQRIPVLKDHVKTIDAEVGDIEAPMEVRVITEDDLPDKRSRDLIGKLGIFCEGVVIKAKDMVEKVKQGLGRTISPGIDMSGLIIRELSLTPTPAIRGLALYSMNGNNALTFDEMEHEEGSDEEMREEYDELCEKFYTLMQNILGAPEEALGGTDPYQLLEQAFGDFVERLRLLFQIDDGEVAEDEGQGQGAVNNPYSMMGGVNTVAPYSLYSYNDAEFALPGMGIAKQFAGGYKRGLGMIGDAFTKEGGFGKLKDYFRTKSPTGRTYNWGRIGKAGLAGAGTLAAGYGGLKLGQAGLRTVGIGREPERRNFFGFKY
jgi:hypothetical protein